MTVSLPEPGKIEVEVTDVDLRTLPAEALRELQDLVYRHKLIVFRGQDLTNEEYLAFARRLGRPQIYFQDHYHHPDHPEIFVSSNQPLDGKRVGVAGTGRFWHTDYSFFEEPLSTTLVYPKVLPSANRETYYIDMEAVLDKMPAELRKHVDGRRAVNEVTMYYKVQPFDIDKSIAELIDTIKADAPPVTHPMVIRHPVTGADLLYISSGFTTSIVGYTHEESQAALRALFEFVERPEHIHRHPWEEGDILYWDNRQLIHMASTPPKGEPSVSYRIGVYDSLPFYTNA